MHGDRELIQIVDAALAEAVRKSGAWLVCRPGCCECCLGPFAITQLDAQRLRTGLQELETSDPPRATRVHQRVKAAAAQLPEMGAEGFDVWMEALPEDEACPVLDPETGTCDLYSARPVTCRVFGPPIRWGGDAVGVCELCFEGATDDQIAACEVQIAIEDSEGETIIALALSD
ncbi:MAG: YkgJ family cysteine cluster protein [Ignavibacteriota bacterium]